MEGPPPAVPVPVNHHPQYTPSPASSVAAYGNSMSSYNPAYGSSNLIGSSPPATFHQSPVSNHKSSSAYNFDWSPPFAYALQRHQSASSSTSFLSSNSFSPIDHTHAACQPMADQQHLDCVPAGNSSSSSSSSSGGSLSLADAGPRLHHSPPVDGIADERNQCLT